MSTVEQPPKPVAGSRILLVDDHRMVLVHRDHIKDKLGYNTSAGMIREAVRWVEAHL